MAAAGDRFLEDKVKIRCNTLNKLGEKWTIEQLINLILHLVTFEKWELVDEDSKYIIEAIQNGEAINVIGFTNADISSGAGAGKVFESFGDVKNAIDTKVEGERKGKQLGLGKKEKKDIVPTEYDWIAKFNSDFLRNPLSDMTISKWKLIKIVPIVPKFYKGALATGRDTRYELTFIGTSGFPFHLLFSPTDTIYICSYESKDWDEKKNRMKIYPPPSADEIKNLCPTGGPGEFNSEQKKIEAKQIIDEILLYLVNDGSWIPVKNKPNAWQVNRKSGNRSDGIFVSWIEGYNQGIPFLDPQVADTWNMRLVEIEEIDDLANLWLFTFEFPQRRRFFATKKVKIPVVEKQSFHVCVPK